MNRFYFNNILSFSNIEGEYCASVPNQTSKLLFLFILFNTAWVIALSYSISEFLKIKSINEMFFIHLFILVWVVGLVILTFTCLISGFRKRVKKIIIKECEFDIKLQSNVTLNINYRDIHCIFRQQGFKSITLDLDPIKFPDYKRISIPSDISINNTFFELMKTRGIPSRVFTPDI